MRDRQGAVPGRRGRQLRSVLEDPEEVRLLEDHRRRILGGFTNPVGVGGPVFVRHLHDLEPEARRIRLDHLTHLRACRLGDHDLRTPGRVLRDEAGVSGHRRAVVAGCVGYVHAGELADRGLVLEHRLQHTLAHLGLVRRVCGEELAALQHRVDDCGHVVVVDAGPEEADLVDDVLRRQLLHVPLQLGLGQRRRNRELTVEAHRGRNVSEELVDGRDADCREHRLTVSRR